MDDLRIGPIDFVDSRSGPPKDGLKKRKQRHAEPEEEPIDQVAFSSNDEIEEQPTGYLPASRDEES